MITSCYNTITIEPDDETDIGSYSPPKPKKPRRISLDDSSPSVEHEVRRSIKRWLSNHLIAFELLDNLPHFLEISP